MVNLGFWIGFVLKTAKMKLPLHDLLIVKATAPFFSLRDIGAYYRGNSLTYQNSGKYIALQQGLKNKQTFAIINEARK